VRPTEKSALEILTTIEATYQPTHRYVPAKAADYRHLDLRCHDNTATRFKSRGFWSLADMETECGDGSSVVTSNAATAAAMANPPLVATKSMPGAPSPLDVYARHTQRLAGAVYDEITRSRSKRTSSSTTDSCRAT
jgi:hypothetical protein